MRLLNLLELDRGKVSRLVSDFGYPEYRAGQLWAWLYRDVAGFGDMTDLPLAFRERLADETWRGIPELITERRASDGTVKALWEYPGGDTAESVLMRYKHGGSVCLSTQVGCRMGCVFCASSSRFVRHLTGGEIMGQYLGMRMLGPVGRVVLMGTGEPLDNLGNVTEFLTALKEHTGLSMRHVSVSTCGLPDGIRRLAQSGLPVTLSVSLHAPDDETRSRLMPVNKRFPVSDVLAACGEYFKLTGRRVSYEYIMIDGVNDSDGQAQLLARLLREGGRPAHVNLIVFNPVPDSPFLPSSRVDAFRKLLEDCGMNVTVRRKLGLDIDAACGQLRNRNSGVV